MINHAYRLARQNYEYDHREPLIRFGARYVILECLDAYESPHHWRKLKNAWKTKTRRNKQYLRHRKN